MKREYNLILLLLITLCLSFVSINVSASEGETTYVYGKEYGYTTDSETIQQVTPYLQHITNIGTGISNYTYKDPGRKTHIFKANIKDSDNLKVVTWAVQKNNEGFQKYGILEIAQDYEKNHPGYIVMAGTNADQFYTGFGTKLGENGSDYFYPQPYYSFISDGNNLFVYSPYAAYDSVVGFKNNNDDVQLLYGTRSVKGLYIHIYDKDNNLVGSYKADDLNIEDELGENQTTILSTQKLYMDKLEDFSKSSSNDFYVIENPDLSYVSNSVKWDWKEYNVNAFFGKGTISKVVSRKVDLSGTQFAIETTNPDLKAKLAEGVYVKCQYEYDDDFAGIKEANGFHTIQILNGEVQDVANGYNTPNYPRSIFGCDDNGNVYLIATEKSTRPKDGLKAQEANALMLQYGITNAFQVDGGGSVQSICRNEDGVLEYAQEPYEGDYRPVLTATFIVMKVEEVQTSEEDITNNSAIINLVDEKNQYSNLGIKLSDGEKETIIEATNGKIVLNDLAKDTLYTYTVVYKKDGEYVESYIKNSFRTLKLSPFISKIELTKDLDGIYSLRILVEDPDDVCLKATMTINGKTYALKLNENETTIKLKNVNKILDYKAEFDCQYTDVRQIVTVKQANDENDAQLYLYHIQSIVDDFFDDLLN